jgi:hypothetical protein
MSAETGALEHDLFPTAKPKAAAPHPLTNSASRAPQAGIDAVESLCMSPDGNRVAWGTKGGDVFIGALDELVDVAKSGGTIPGNTLK